MDLSDDELGRLAELARIALPDEERHDLRRDLTALLNAFRDVRRADDDPDRSPLLRPGVAAGGLRDDRVAPEAGLPRERVLALAHGSEDGRIRVPRTAGDDG